MKGGAFHRAITMMAAVSAIMQIHAADFAGQQAALGALGPYTSRGKGGKRAHRPTGIAAVRRAAGKRRNVQRNRRAHHG